VGAYIDEEKIILSHFCKKMKDRVEISKIANGSKQWRNQDF